MNYFSHYFVDGIEGRHQYNTGLLLPDITRKMVSRFTPNSAYTQGELEFYEGCEAHYLADKNFHSSVFFQDILKLSGDLMNDAPFDETISRKWFLAHILAELMIDRILVKNHPQKLDAFYSSLNAINDEELAHFLILNGMEKTAEFFDFFNHFRKVQYIYYYADNNKFVYSLNRIMIRAGVGELSEYNQKILLETALKLEQRLARKVPEMIEQLIESKKGK